MIRTRGWTALTQSPRYQWAVVSMSILAVFGAVGLGRYGYSAILPEMQTRIGLSVQQAGELASWNLVGYSLLTITGGALAARFGTRRVVTVGIFLSALGMLGTGLSNGVALASAGRILTGIGAGMVFVPCIALMSSWFSYHRRGLASGIVSSGGALGLVITGPVVPRLMATGGEDGWRIAWYFFASVTFLLAICNLFIMRDRPRQRTRSDPRSPIHKEPLVWTRVVTSRYAWHLGLIYLLFGFAHASYLVFFQKRLIHDLGFSAEAAGNLYLLLGVGALVCGAIWGSLSDRIGRSQAIAIMAALNTAAAGLFAFWPTSVGLVISAAIFGLAGFSIAGIVGAACGDRFGAALAPVSLGFVALFAGVGQAVGPVIAGRMGDVFSSLAPAYGLSAGLFLVSAAGALLLGRLTKEDHAVHA
jgi:sugar phosphate permease